MSEKTNPFVDVIQDALRASQEGSLAPEDFATLLEGIADALESIVRAELVERWWIRASILAAAAGLRQLAAETRTKNTDDTATE